MALKLVKTDLPFHAFSTAADHDYLLARLIALKGNGGFLAIAGFHAQQACEKYLKALSVQHDGLYAESHKLIELAERLEPLMSFLKSAKQHLQQFDMFDQVGRYGPAAKFDPLSKGTPIGGVRIVQTPAVQVAGAWLWSPASLDCLDALVFNLRGRLDFAKAGIADGLKAILTGDPKHAFASSWEEPPSLKEVLTRDNRYFTEDPTAKFIAT